MKEKCGSQDPIWASYGGFNKIIFNKKNFFVKKYNLNQQQLRVLSRNFFLIYTGINKFSNNIEKDKISNLSKNIYHLDSIYDLAKNFSEEISVAKNYDFIGNILNEYWNIKKKLSFKVTNPIIDEIYNESLIAGASGGKLIGSGGGGFLLVYCKKRYHKSLINRLAKLPVIKFKFINTGSKIIFKS